MGDPELSPYLQRAIDSGTATAAIPSQATSIDDYLVF